MSTPTSSATESHPSQDQQESRHPWIRLLLALTLPVLWLLVGISLTR
jgi:hypothetical protein